MLKRETLYSLDDVCIIQAPVSKISHRSECYPYYLDGMLPIFTSPMPCVVNQDTLWTYKNAKINPIIPRTESLEFRESYLKNPDNISTFVAFSLAEFKNLLNDPELPKTTKTFRVLIDLANGNMEDLHNTIGSAKKLLDDKIKIMSGNIANPEAFRKLMEAGCDYIRCSVGSGAGCNTTTYTGVYYPMASLIDECNEIRKGNPTVKIIADGGIKNYRDCFKCLALGADYVMMGSIFAALSNSPAEKNENGEKIYFGMASSVGMRSLGKTNIKNTEGMVKLLKPNPLTIFEWSEEFTGYLRSCMSYCGARRLDEFIQGTNTQVISPSSQQQYNK